MLNLAGKDHPHDAIRNPVSVLRWPVYQLQQDPEGVQRVLVFEVPAMQKRDMAAPQPAPTRRELRGNLLRSTSPVEIEQYAVSG